MHAELSPSAQRIKQALNTCPYVGATLLIDDKPRPGEPTDGSMFCASFVLPSSAILTSLTALEQLLPSFSPAWVDAHGGLLGLLLETPEALNAMINFSCADAGIADFDKSSAFSNIHERKFWTLGHTGGETPLLGLSFSYYGSGNDGKHKGKTYHSRDAFSCLWAAFAKRLATRLNMSQSPHISEAFLHSPRLHEFHLELPQGLEVMWQSQSEKSLLLSQINSAVNVSKHRSGL